MPLLRVDVVGLLPELREALEDLLDDLGPEDWSRPTACPGWSVHDLVCHLFGVEVGNVSARRDGWKLRASANDDPDEWLDRFNQEWVDAARRLSPLLLSQLVAWSGREFEEHVRTLDLEAGGAPVRWATGDRPAPVWLDIAREYMERFVHQWQLRRATGRPTLGAHFAGPALSTAVHCLPMALAGVGSPEGSYVNFIVEGHGGGSWRVVRAEGAWELHLGAGGQPSCEVRTTVDGALKLFVRDPSAPHLRWSGDAAAAQALAGAKAVLG